LTLPNRGIYEETIAWTDRTPGRIDMKKSTWGALLALTLVLMLALAGCAQEADTGDEGDTGDETTDEAKGPIKVGSKIDTEGALLGQIIIQMLEADGFEVEDDTTLGPTDVNRNALLAGEIDVYPEYTGTAAFVFLEGEEINVNDATDLYNAVKELDEANDVTWLAASPANNTWAVAIPRSLSDAEAIVTWEDFADYVNGGGEVKLVGSQEFIERDDALGAFEAAYGFELADDQLIALAGGNTAQSEQAAASGTDGANAAMAYGTDGSLAALDLVVLEDTMGAQPIYQPAPTFRSEVIEAYPEIPGILDPVFESLTLEVLQDLNGRIAVDGEAAADVANDYLTSNGFLD
jgi:osmoprotectant transport system substrate-binding protein